MSEVSVAPAGGAGHASPGRRTTPRRAGALAVGVVVVLVVSVWLWTQRGHDARPLAGPTAATSPVPLVAAVDLAPGYEWAVLTDEGDRVVLLKRGSPVQDEVVVLDLATGGSRLASLVPKVYLRGRGTT